MRVLDLLSEPWAILPTKKAEIDAIYMTHLRGPKIDLKDLEARLGRPLGNQREYQVIDGAAILPIEGVLSKRMSLLHDVSGGTSTEKMAAQFEAAMQDPQVNSIVLHVDSPGGAVDGTKAFADQVFQARGQKPITAYVDGLAASAAYWIASAADKVFIKDTTAMIGSIGVVATHIDQSQADAKEGITVTEITAGKFKRADSQHAPLTKEGRGMIQDRVDALYEIFVSDVARNRGVSVDTVLSDMADGRVFIGMDAVERGLVDGVSSLTGVMTNSNSTHPAFAGATATEPALEVSMPDPEIQDPVTTPEPAPAPDPEPEPVAPVTDGASAERGRIQGVLALSIPGAEKLVQELAFDGKTTPEQAAVAILAFHQKTLAGEAAALVAGASQPVAVIAAAQEDNSAGLRAKWDSLHPSVKSAHGSFENYQVAMTRTAELQAQGRVRHFQKTK